MPKITPTPRGRPQIDPLPKDIVKIEKLAAEGCLQIEIARSCNVSKGVLQRWRREFPEVKEALEAGLAKEHKALHSILIEKALAGDTVALLFALKTRHGYREAAPVESESRLNVTITLPGALSPEQYEKEIGRGSTITE